MNRRGAQKDTIAIAKRGRGAVGRARQPEPVKTDAAVDRRIRRTRKAIRGALQELLHETSLEQITIREIAAKADVSYTTFFRHYPDKEAVLADLANDQVVRLLDLCLPLVNVLNEETYAACLAACKQIDKDRVLWTALLTGGAAGAIRSSFIERTLEKAADMPRTHDWLPVDIGTTIAVGITLDLLSWWLGRANDAPPEQIAEMLDKLLATIVRRKKR
jgi:AcrR family transcriptional regulator